MENIIKAFSYAALFLLLVVSGKAGAQTSFAKVYSGNGYDRGEGICQLADSSFLVTGTSSSFQDSPSQAFLLHVDSLGNFIWSKAYGGSESETGRRVIAVEGFGYYVAGTSSSSGSGDFDNYVFFTDESGNQQWETFTDKGGWERINDAVLVSGDTSIITVGQSDAAADFIDDIYICRYSKTGVLLWDTVVGTPAGSDVANAVEMLTDTSFIVAGSYYVEDSLANKAYLALFHIDGSIIWEKKLGEDGDFWLNDLSLVSGRIKAVGENIKPAHSDYDAYTLTCLYDGTYFASQEYAVAQSVRVGHIVQYEPGAGGRQFISEQTINTTYPTFADGEDVFIQRNTESFNWDNYGYSYSGVGQDEMNQMVPTSDGFAVAVGYNTAYGGGGNCVLLVKIGDDNHLPPFTTDPEVDNILNLSENGLIENLIVYPNPVIDQLHIKLEGKQFSYKLIDLSGRKIKEGSSFNEESFDVSGQSQGAYLLKVTADNKQMIFRIIR